MDIFRSPSRTIEYLLRTQAIPFLIVDYSKDSIEALMYRKPLNNFIYVVATYNKLEYDIQLKMMIVTDELVTDAIIKSTKMVLDHNILSEDTFLELLESISHAHEILRSKMIKINNKKGTGFTESDFDVIIRAASKMKFEEKYWEL